MTQLNDNTPERKHKHLTLEERAQIEILKRVGHSNREIARTLGRAPQTVNNEVKRGTVLQKRKQVQNKKTYQYTYPVYFSDVGQRQYEANRIHSKRQPKWVHIPALMDYADEKMLDDGWSPDAVIGALKKEFPLFKSQLPCTTTLYDWIDTGIMRTKNIDLFEKVSRAPRKRSRHGRENVRKLGTSIEARPKHIENRSAFGHWEIDTVQGIQGADDAVLLTLVERKTRLEVLMKIDRKDAGSVSHAMRELADKAGTDMASMFKTITSDNGSEFSTLENDLKSTTSVYFCHPYASYERGTSENQHRFIRRHMPKGKSLRDVSESHVLRTQQWMNTYPRKILNYRTPQEAFKDELKCII